MQLYLTMVQCKVVNPGKFRLLHLENYLLQNGPQFIETCQLDLLDLEEPVLLVSDLTDLKLQVVELPVSKPTISVPNTPLRTEEAIKTAGCHLTRS